MHPFFSLYPVVPQALLVISFSLELAFVQRYDRHLFLFQYRLSLLVTNGSDVVFFFLFLFLRKAFLKFCRRHSALVEKSNVSLKTLLQQAISEPEFYGNLVYKFWKLAGKSNFSEQFRKLINRYKKSVIAWILCGRLHA